MARGYFLDRRMAWGGLDFSPFRLHLAPFRVRLAPFRVCFGSVSGPFRVRFGLLGGVGGERGFGKGKNSTTLGRRRNR